MQDFDELVTQYTPMIYHSIHRLKMYKHMDEFFQLGLIALWEASERFDQEKGNFSAYAFTCIRGKMLTELKKIKLSEERYVFPDEEYWDVVQGEQNLEIDIQLLFNQFPELNQRQKQWCIYTFQDGLTVREIAERENVSLSAVKKWRSTAKEILRKTLKEAL